MTLDNVGRAEVAVIREVAEMGDPEAQRLLGCCYEQGRGVALDPVEAAKWYRLSAEQGDPLAQYQLGFCYRIGRGVPWDHVEACRWYKLAAEQGDAAAQFEYGMALSFGYGERSVAHYGKKYLPYNAIKEDLDESKEWIWKAAQQGHELAIEHIMEYSGERDSEILNYYEGLAREGNADAQFMLGRMLSHARRAEVSQADQAEAAKLYRLAAEQGHPKAQYCLGRCLEDGCGIPQDKAEAVKWYKLAAGQGHREALTRALVLVRGKGRAKG